MIKNEITNPKLKAETYKTLFLESGVVAYAEGNVYISPANLMNIASKFKGAKVIIDHKDVNENNTNDIVGYINNIWRGDDGHAWCDFIVNNKEAISLINQDYGASCCYIPVSNNKSGTKNNVPYDYEIIDIVEDDSVTHLAIVKYPRYEDAIILKNSINKIMTIFKFKKENKENKEKKENKAEVKEIEPENAFFEFEDGETVYVSDMVLPYKNAKKNEAEEEKKKKEAEEEKNKKEAGVKVNADDDFEVDGEMVKVSELASAYKASEKKNEEEEEEEAKKNEEEEKENEAEEEKKKEEVKKNSIDAKKIEDAKKKFENGSESLTNSKVMTDRSRFDLGESLYGSAQPISK